MEIIIDVNKYTSYASWVLDDIRRHGPSWALTAAQYREQRDWRISQYTKVFGAGNFALDVPPLMLVRQALIDASSQELHFFFKSRTEGRRISRPVELWRRLTGVPLAPPTRQQVTRIDSERCCWLAGSLSEWHDLFWQIVEDSTACLRRAMRNDLPVRWDPCGL